MELFWDLEFGIWCFTWPVDHMQKIVSNLSDGGELPAGNYTKLHPSPAKSTQVHQNFIFPIARLDLWKSPSPE
jgi:hypothetical protein